MAVPPVLSDLVSAPNAPNRSGRGREDRRSKFYEVSDNLELLTGPESVEQTVRSLQSAFGDLRFEVEDEIAEGDKVVQLVTMSGRHTGPLAAQSWGE
jgi:predicted ester cyclase